MTRYVCAAALILTTFISFAPTTAGAQQVPQLLVPGRAAGPASPRDVPARRTRAARINPAALNSAIIQLDLFDDVQVTMKRLKSSRPSADRLVWVGGDDNGAQAVLTMVRGVLTGTVFADHRTFEIAIASDGQYIVAELDPDAYPTDDPLFDGVDVRGAEVPDALEGDASASAETGSASTSATPVQVDVMIVWTPNAETAQGGASAMESLALNAVANANLVYANSGVNAELHLVYTGVVAYAETVSSISTDLNVLRSSSDGIMDNVHAIRSTYGADIVTLLGTGYASNGYCGIGGLMSSVSTAFASSAFNVVDRTCAVGNLSYAHELGHNQGLHHDPANAGSTPSYPYAYGYQDPSGYFRTVLSYGGATRVPYLSSPNAFYTGMATGTASQDNARALNANVMTVAAFRTAGGTTAPPPACTYAVSTTSLSFAAGGGSKTVTVTAPTGCTWNAVNGAATAWVSLGPTAGTGSGSVTVSATANAGTERGTTVTIAGQSVAISQSAARTKGRK